MVRGTVTAAAVTVCTTYAISVAHHDAPVIPMISDTFVKAPESYISRLGIVTVATLLQLTVWFLHSYLCAFAAPTRVWRCFTLVHSLAGALGSIALGLVGAVNNQENLRAHFDAATTFFVAILAWQICYTAQLAAHPDATSPASLRLKCTCAVTTFTSLVAFFILASMDIMGYYRQVATCEWISAFGSMVSLWSLSVEFGGGELVRGPSGGGDGGAGRGLELGSLWRGPTPGAGRTRGIGAAAAAADEALLLEDKARGCAPEGAADEECGSYRRLP